jgi:hypothetical protein
MHSLRSISRNPHTWPVTLGFFLAAAAVPVSGCVGEFGTGDPGIETTTSSLEGFQGWGQIPGGIFNSGPAAAAMEVLSSVETEEVCGLGMDNRIWCALWSSQVGWSTFTPLGTQTFTGRPGMLSFTDRFRRIQLAVVANNASGETMINVSAFDPLALTSTFQGWTTIPGSGSFSLPAAIVLQGNKFHVFGVKADQRMYYASNDITGGVFNNSNWSVWREVPGGGLFNAAPSATRLFDDGHLALAGRGLDNRFWVTEGATPDVVNGWHLIPSSEQTVAPAIGSLDFTVNLFGAFSGDQRVRYTIVNPTFSPPQPIFGIIPDGLLDTPVAVAVRASNKYDIVSRGLDGAFWINRNF